MAKSTATPSTNAWGKPNPIIMSRDQQILFKEYGRNVQSMVEFIKAEDDRAKRTQLAKTLIELMRMLNPLPGNDTPDFYHKLWDHLHIMAGFELDVESPFPVPTPEKVAERPQPLKLPGSHIKLKNYGKNIELIMEKAALIEDVEEREAAIGYIGRLIKSFYAGYNKEILDDANVLGTIRELSNGKLTMDLAKIEAEGLFAVSSRPAVHNFQHENQQQGREGREPREQQRQGGQNFRGKQNNKGGRRRY
jgi:hypothetical protein